MNSLSRARAGRYRPQATEEIPRDKLQRFFIQERAGLSVRPFVREACRFTLHDLAQSPPFSSLDLIYCRGMLAPLPPSARKNALRSFHSALAPGGVLLSRIGIAAEVPELFVPTGDGSSYVARKVLTNAAPPSIVNAQLRENEKKLQFLFSNTKEAILVEDAETGLILEANAAAERLLGLSLSELVTMRVKELLVAPEAVRRPKTERRSEARLRLPHYRRKDGTLFPADTDTTFLMLRGRPCNLWMLRDATQRLRADSSRNREEARIAFVGEVVHELRNPISVIQGSVETLRRGVQGRGNQAAFLKFIENHAGRMAHLVDSLLDLSAVESAKRETKPSEIRIAEVLWDIAGTFIPAAKRRGISIKIDIEENLTVLADPADLPHVFGNLLDNAIKFNPRGGEVHVRGRAEGVEGILSVRDTGSGIAPEDLSRIFDRFYRSERTRRVKGTGLGLAIVRRIVNANRGRVLVENHPSGGAVFHVALPLAPS